MSVLVIDGRASGKDLPLDRFPEREHLQTTFRLQGQPYDLETIEAAWTLETTTLSIQDPSTTSVKSIVKRLTKGVSGKKLAVAVKTHRKL